MRCHLRKANLCKRDLVLVIVISQVQFNQQELKHSIVKV